MPNEAFMPHPVVPKRAGATPHTSIIPPFPCATLRAIPYCLEFAMRRELAIEFSRVTESAALAGYKWLGRGDKNTADGAAVNAMRIMLNQSTLTAPSSLVKVKSTKHRCSTLVKKSVLVAATR